VNWSRVFGVESAKGWFCPSEIEGQPSIAMNDQKDSGQNEPMWASEILA
jgi:hypothetical protein